VMIRNRVVEFWFCLSFFETTKYSKVYVVKTCSMLMFAVCVEVNVNTVKKDGFALVIGGKYRSVTILIMISHGTSSRFSNGEL
jgi:hypothetical protein